jgi:prepilin signal peptidase PulO-like enzyme (type II secretory pathway)
MSLEPPNSMMVLEAAFGGLLFAIVAVLSIADFRRMILPNRLNFLLAVGGIGQAAIIGQPGVLDAVFGGLLGFGILAAVAALFRHVRGVDGLGFGDQKFAAAAGLWVGWTEIPHMLLIAACSTLVFVAIRAAKERRFDVAARVPFGPFLGLGIIVCWSAVAKPGL